MRQWDKGIPVLNNDVSFLGDDFTNYPFHHGLNSPRYTPNPILSSKTMSGLSEKDKYEVRTFLQVGQTAYAGAIGIASTLGALGVGSAAAAAAAGGPYAVAVAVTVALLIMAFGGKPEDAIKILGNHFSDYAKDVIDVDLPEIDLPEIDLPEVSLPGVSMPGIELPENPIEDLPDLPDLPDPKEDINQAIDDSNLPPEIKDKLKKDVANALHFEMSEEDFMKLMGNWKCEKNPVKVILAGIKKNALCTQKFNGESYYVLEDGSIRKNLKKDLGGPLMLAGGALLLLVTLKGGE